MTLRHTWIGLGLAAGLALAGLAAPSQGGDSAKKPDDWLLNAPDDATRFKMLQGQFRGFSASMIEIGQRFDSLYDAVQDKNPDLAAHQLLKIKEVMVQGYTRRPNRQNNADAIFVNGVYEPALADFKSGDPAKAADAFQRVRKACIACHEAEKVGFFNNQPRFRRTEK